MHQILSITSIYFWLYFLAFSGVFIISVLIPGLVIVKSIKLPGIVGKFLLATSIGIAMWSVQGYVFGYLQMRWMTYLYILIFSVSYLANLSYHKNEFIHLFKVHPKLPLLFYPILILGVAAQLFPIVTSGFMNSAGVKFLQINIGDGVLHLAFIQSLVENVPPNQPGATGILITNYHYWSDLFIAELARIWHLPIIHLYFQFIPAVLSPLLAIASYYVVYVISDSKKAGLISLVLYFFVGDLAYLLYMIIHGSISFHPGTIDNGVIQFINMPQAFAKYNFLLSLYLMKVWSKRKSAYSTIILGFLLGSLVGFKVYFGIFAAMGVTFVFIAQALSSIFKKNKHRSLLKFLNDTKYVILLCVIMALVSSIIFFPANKDSGGLYFYLLDWPKLYLGRDYLNWDDWWLRMQVYVEARSFKNVTMWNLVSLATFMISVYGIRLIGFIPSKAILKKMGIVLLSFLLPATLAFTFLGLNTIQSSGGHNTFNFFVVALSILSLTTAINLAQLLRWKLLFIPVLVIIGISIPRSVDTLRSFVESFVTGKDVQTISRDEIEALKYIADNTNVRSVVQAYSVNDLEKDTPYVPFFSQRNSFFSGGGTLVSHNQPVLDREVVLKNIFSWGLTAGEARHLIDLGITHLYVPSRVADQYYQSLWLPIVFQNETVSVVEINRDE